MQGIRMYPAREASKPVAPSAILAVLALNAFAGSALPYRPALVHTPIDAASFTAARLLSGLSTPPLMGALLMPGAEGAGDCHSMPGKGAGNPLQVTASHSARAVPCGALPDQASLGLAGIGYALLSGALTSGVGYVIWYASLPSLKSTTAATVQLSVPVVGALGAILFLQEPLTLRLLVASAAIIGGIALVVLAGDREKTPAHSLEADGTDASQPSSRRSIL